MERLSLTPKSGEDSAMALGRYWGGMTSIPTLQARRIKGHIDLTNHLRKTLPLANRFGEEPTLGLQNKTAEGK